MNVGKCSTRTLLNTSNKLVERGSIRRLTCLNKVVTELFDRKYYTKCFRKYKHEILMERVEK